MNLVGNFVGPSLLCITQVSSFAFFGHYLSYRNYSCWVMNKVKKVVVIVDSCELIYILNLEGTMVLTR